MIDKTSSLEEIHTHVWGTLARGGADAKHPYHFPVMATCKQNEAHQRTLVLRKVGIEKRLLLCYSDVRTQKVEDINLVQLSNWLFYNHQDKEQLRVRTRVVLHHQDELCREIWNNIPPKNRADYIGPMAPGSITESYTANLPDNFMESPTEANTAQGWKNFSVIECEVYEIDFLKLMKGGHLRALFSWKENAWEHNWLAP